MGVVCVGAVVGMLYLAHYQKSTGLRKIKKKKKKKVLNIAKCTANFHQILGHFLLVFTVISGTSSNC